MHICIIKEDFSDDEALWEAACGAVRSMPRQVTLIGRSSVVANLFKRNFANVTVLKKGSSIPEGAIVIKQTLSKAQEDALDEIEKLIKPYLD